MVGMPFPGRKHSFIHEDARNYMLRLLFLYFSNTWILLDYKQTLYICCFDWNNTADCWIWTKTFLSILVVSHLLLKFSNELLNLNLVKITAWLEIRGRCKIERGPQFFTAPTTLKLHFNICIRLQGLFGNRERQELPSAGSAEKKEFGGLCKKKRWWSTWPSFEQNTKNTSCNMMMIVVADINTKYGLV